MKTKLKETYMAPKVEILELIHEGIVCDSSNSASGENFGWDDES